jgi:hypothetical protein
MNLDFIAISKIYELKGIVESLVELADQDESYNYPMIEKLESKINEVIRSLEDSIKTSA